ncbi:MAG: RNA polymerase sigma factor [Cyclobacteriaceae bacterium]
MDKASTLAKAKNGDINAFNQLFSNYQPTLKGYLYRLHTDRDEVDDLYHDIFIQSFDHIREFRGTIKQLKGWIFQIATNMSLNRLQKKKRWNLDAQDICRDSLVNHPEIQKRFAQSCQESTYNKYEIKEHVDFCFTCIAQTIPIRQQLALLLKDSLGFKVKEIGEILGLTEGKIKHLLRDGRNTMIKVYKGRCSLINRKGTCYQCTELQGIFNPQSEAQRELMKVKMAQEPETKSEKKLYQLRAEIIDSINPMNANGRDLHDLLMQHMKKVNKLK